MPFKSFTPGVLTSSDVNTFLMQQAVITCTSTTRPTSPVTGMTIYETNTNAYALYDGSDWVYQGRVLSYTPVMTEWTLGNGSLTGHYLQIGKFVRGVLTFEFGSTSVASSTPGLGPLFSPPVPVSTVTVFAHEYGMGAAQDLSTGFSAPVQVRNGTGRTFRPQPMSKASLTDYVTSTSGLSNTIPFTWDTGDLIKFSFHYLAA
jgi:hypothetical protein